MTCPHHGHGIKGIDIELETQSLFYVVVKGVAVVAAVNVFAVPAAVVGVGVVIFLSF